MTLDPLILSRLQFFWVIAWHILLPAFTVGLASYVAFLELIVFVSGSETYRRLSAFWTRIFAISFGMGVVSGVIMPFQLGTNWSRFSDATANVLSPLLAYEGLTAFFLEAAFLGVLLFGRDRVPKGVHFFAAVMVAAGTLFSSFWILATNSWMQTPAGYALIDGRFYPRDWWAIIFNPSFPYRLTHTVAAFYVTTGFVVLGVGAWLVRQGRHVAESREMVSNALWFVLIMVPIQILLGDLQGLNTREHQPAKLAAIEARWETGRGVPLTLFAIPDQKGETNHLAVEVPKLGSLILTHDINGEVKGLKDFPAADRAPVIIPFFTFRLMVGIGLLLLSVAVVGNLLRLKGRLWNARWFLVACTWIAPLGFVAVIAGWTTTEVGRQPWTVYGLMRTAHSVTPSLTGAAALATLLGYMATYLVMFPAGALVMARIIRHGPGPAKPPAPVEAGRPAEPIRPVPFVNTGKDGEG